jgi:3-hydroxybutyrate dehydrogenase
MPLTNPAFPPGPSPAQLGVTVAFLCSAAADQITGTAIAVDGG